MGFLRFIARFILWLLALLGVAVVAMIVLGFFFFEQLSQPHIKVPDIEPEDLAGLACEEAALSRIVVHDRKRDRWELRHGPFEEEAFPKMPRKDWTLLVQDVDKWDADIRALIPYFSFLPRWRIDDVMISFAAPGGSVGPHTDQYDVFLLQAHGHRRWQISTDPKAPQDFRDDAELKLLKRFTPTHEWVLAPGDMLYLPPGVPHHGGRWMPA